MRCLNCGKDYADGAAFCPDCGAANPNVNNSYQNPNQNMNYGQGGGPYRAPIKNRSIALCIILSIVTCGIYGIVWLISMADDLNTASGATGDTSGAMVFVLTLVTCGIYGLYWMYKAGEKVSTIRQMQGMADSGNNGILYLVLSIFGLGIVSYCLIKSELNNVASL